jgi:dolichol kinase
MIHLLLAVIPVGIILLASEYLWRKKIIRGEKARKFIHILAGVYIAFWPLYLPMDGIFILGCIALTFLVYSRFSPIFHAVYGVRRKTYGELFFALAIIICSVVATETWIFTTSILFLSIADGGAAVAGKLWGNNNSYKVWNMSALQKSRAGTTAYFLLSYVCLGIGWFMGGSEVMQQYSLIIFLLMPISTTLLENISPYGLDNFFTPLYVTLVLINLG